MQSKPTPLLQFSNISLKYDDQVILDDISGSITARDRIGLIGINGSGKSSLLQILTEKIEANSGAIQSKAQVKYLPQLDLEIYRKDIPLYKYLQKQTEYWWDVLTKHQEIFGTTLNENQSLNTLSGGELVKVHLSLSLCSNPDLLLLDEPTNHLDLSSLKQLQKVLRAIDIPYIVVSHNINFLNEAIDTIWELDNGNLEIYGGNYDFYREQKEQRIEARKRKYIVKKKEMRKLEDSIEKEQKRAQRSHRTGRKLAKFGGTDGFARTYFKDKSEKSAGTNSDNLNEKKAEITDEMKKYKVKVRKAPYLDFSTSPKTGLIIQIQKGELAINNSHILLKDINFKLYHGDRIAILGDNGCGKTTFVKQLSYEVNKNECILKGKIKYGQKYKTLYVDQQYDVVTPQESLIHNIQKHNPKINYENARRILGNLSFPMDYDINKKAVNLSGGETARLAFAIATSSEVDLLVLDEPTNNLDIETIDVIVEALAQFPGTLVVISHDISFLKRIEIQKVFEIKDKSLRRTKINI
jgi:ATPase subunit of ABC transporter with duplicated ATPase domains